MNHSDIIVYVRGGVVDGVIANRDGLRVMIVDYDNEEGVRAEQRKRRFTQVERDERLFAATVEGKEY